MPQVRKTSKIVAVAAEFSFGYLPMRTAPSFEPPTADSHIDAAGRQDVVLAEGASLSKSVSAVYELHRRIAA